MVRLWGNGGVEGGACETSELLYQGETVEGLRFADDGVVQHVANEVRMIGHALRSVPSF